MPDTEEATEQTTGAERDADTTEATAERDAGQEQTTEAKGPDQDYLRKLERENKKRVADVAELKKQLATLKAASDQQRDALAKALGLKPDDASPEQLAAKLKEAQTSADTLKAALHAERVRNLTLIAATAAGAPDVDVVLAMIDPKAIEVEEDGTVKPEAVEAAVNALKERKPRLFQSPTEEQKPPLGATKPGQAANAGTFTAEQLRDPRFYAEHREEILAMATKARR